MQYRAVRDITGFDLFAEFAEEDEKDRVYVEAGTVGDTVYESDHSVSIDFHNDDVDWSFRKDHPAIEEVKSANVSNE